MQHTRTAMLQATGNYQNMNWFGKVWSRF